MAYKILTIDDSGTIRMIISRTLKNYDCTVCEAGNGEEGLLVAAAEKPDVILLDIAMPVMDGVTMLTKLRDDPALKNIPVIMLTPEPSRGNEARIAQPGASDTLIKPFKENQLIETLSRIIPLVQKTATEVLAATAIA